jgi:hypothetical protein
MLREFAVAVEVRMARKPSGKEAAAVELADKLLRVLQAQRALGPDAYPLTVRRLAELTEPGAAPALLRKALNKRSFLQQAVPAHGKLLDAPIALAADLDGLAASSLLLEFLMRQARTAATNAFTVSDLGKKASGKVKKGFQDAVNRQIAQGILPPTVAWVSIRGSKKLFLLSELHASAKAKPPPPAVPSAAPPEPAPAPPGEFRTAFDQAFERLDRQQGGHNFVSLIALRRALPVARDQFDRELRQLRQSGRYTLSAAEGRGGITPEEREAGISEEGSLLLFVSRNQP